ncbi:hypothetical protein H2201_004834 [Coniosporium apollinis]|uniref:AAA+ ATPase domain-containing protein n=1 Tax=Coniosporium apollinis TaxID=61459 RepID=A0ABQ9NRE3_9PEZI|nr:hypothetical protein H2201_004834 [Coniosporium apollinis]
MLLEGPPGVGKTLTAESVAEHMKAPLYSINAGQISEDMYDMEESLHEVFQIAKRWRAVLLLDESDVFLQERTNNNMEGNRVVSVFLRLLEYHEGILSLTTNRVTSMDAAFLSRIHLTLHFPDLDVPSRKYIWSNFLRLVHCDHELSERGVSRLAQININGREIKNLIKTAELLALSHKKKLALEHIQTVLRVTHRTVSFTPMWRLSYFVSERLRSFGTRMMNIWRFIRGQ